MGYGLALLRPTVGKEKTHLTLDLYDPEPGGSRIWASFTEPKRCFDVSSNGIAIHETDTCTFYIKEFIPMSQIKYFRREF